MITQRTVRTVLFFCTILVGNCLSAQTIMPCTIQGVCTVCNTTSCANCPKLGPVTRSEPTVSSDCGVCNNDSRFCSTLATDQQGTGPCLGRCGPLFSAFIPRSQGTNTARELAGWEEFIHQYDVGEYYITTGHVLGYSRSFRPERVAQYLFGDTVLRFSGSQVEERGPCELLADNFGISPTVRGSVTIDPLIENIIFDNQFFVGLDPIACGLYARFHLPVVHTRWNLRMSQNIETDRRDCTDFPACYMSEDAAEASCTILDALAGQNTFGDMKQPWSFGHILNGVQTKTGLADIDVIVGYDIRQTDTSHYGFYGQLVIPTGNRYTGCSLFQPIVGNARHVELGAGFSGHIVLLERDAENSMALYLEANVMHMFKNTQMRSFDFCGHGPLSRYMLLKEVDEQFQYTGNLINGIDFATRPVSVQIAAKGDVSAKLAIRTPRIIADLGYNFFGQTREHINFKKCRDDRRFVIKGTEGVCGLEYQTTDDPPSFGQLVRKIPLNSSQSQATIRQAAPTDNPQSPETVAPTNIVVTAFSRQEGPTQGAGVILAQVSQPPVLITTQSLHRATGQVPAQATHKVFGYLGYNLYDYDWCASPYLGIGGEVEFDARSIDERTALNQWSVWLKGGFEF